MANSHYYSRSSGRVIRRPDADAEGKLGGKVGHKHRKRDQDRGNYPAPGLPVRRLDKSAAWVAGYIKSYYQPHLGGEDLSDRDPVIAIDRALLEQIDLMAECRSISRYQLLIALLRP